jgi:hypothetical protein
MTATFIDIVVEPHAALRDGCSIRFKAQGETRPVHHVRYEPDDGPEGIWQVFACDPDGLQPARATVVDDSSAGLSVLIWGGTLGLRLRHEPDGMEVAEPYLLLAQEELLD